MMNILAKGTQIFAVALLSGLSATAGASAILFAHVDRTGSYVDDGNRIRDMLTDGGHTVTTRYLNEATYTDYSSFDQIFVYDLYLGTNNNTHQAANYTGIADWYNNLADMNLILDGRIISSDIAWENPPETAWVQNYATQLEARGGGLFLGTDHANLDQTSGVFVDGINEIASQISVGLFNSYFYEQPFEALVDPLSPLYVPTLSQCVSSPADQCINDSSSTSFVATGEQANGQFLTPVAYHGTTSQAFEQAAVSSTIGSVTFETCDDGSLPPCDGQVPEPGTIALVGLGLAGLGFRRRRKA